MTDIGTARLADAFSSSFLFELADPWFSGEVKTAPSPQTQGRSGE